MFKISGLIVALCTVAFLLFATSKPDSFEVERSIKIKAPPDTVFRLVNDLHQWETWSPWAEKDPEIKSTFRGANSGIGAVHEWSGNRGVGSGRMEIIGMSRPTSVEIQLQFLEPFVTDNIVEFRFENDDDYTEASWRIRGPMPYVSKLISIFVRMDEMLGVGFETGLVNLKMVAEK